MASVHRNIRIRGKVQGVYFRASTRNEAVKLGLNGFVRNEPDGSVYVEAEGESSRVEALVAWCAHGPAPARVTATTVNEGPLQGFRDFTIER